MQNAIGRLDTLKIDTTGATVFAGQFPFVMKKRNNKRVIPFLTSLGDMAKALSVPASRPSQENERIAMTLDSTLSPDSSVRRFYQHVGSKWVLNDMPAECPKSSSVHRDSILAHDFVSPTVTMQSDDPKIKTLADSLVKNATTRCDSIDACFRWVYATLEKRPSPTFPNAIEVLESGFGDCKEHSVLIGALLRAVKIPARVIYGLVYWQHKGYSYHAWVMAENNDAWLFVDPALGVFPAYRDRVPLLIDDFGSESVRMAKFIGRIEIEYVKK
jgi:transglutaminase-like putative cysteine protease